MNLLSLQLKSWRMAKGLTQSVLAENAGIPRPNLIDLELGRRDCTVQTLVKLAEALGLSPGQLLDQQPPQSSKPVLLNRHEREAVVLSIVTGQGALTAPLKAMANEFLPLFRPSLEACGIKRRFSRSRHVRKTKHHLEILYSRAFVAKMVQSVRKLLPLYASELMQ
jgi:transcriptional regulator with XRE-family HTH domain